MANAVRFNYQQIKEILHLNDDEFNTFKEEIWNQFLNRGLYQPMLNNSHVRSFVNERAQHYASRFSFIPADSRLLSKCVNNIVRQENNAQKLREKRGTAAGSGTSRSSTDKTTRIPRNATAGGSSSGSDVVPPSRTPKKKNVAATSGDRSTSSIAIKSPQDQSSSHKAGEREKSVGNIASASPSKTKSQKAKGKEIKSFSQVGESSKSSSQKVVEERTFDRMVFGTILIFRRPDIVPPITRIPLKAIISFVAGCEQSLLTMTISYSKLEEALISEISFERNNEILLTVEDHPLEVKSDLSVSSYIQRAMLKDEDIYFIVSPKAKRDRSITPPSDQPSNQHTKRQKTDKNQSGDDTTEAMPTNPEPEAEAMPTNPEPEAEAMPTNPEPEAEAMPTNPEPEAGANSPSVDNTAEDLQNVAITTTQDTEMDNGEESNHSNSAPITDQPSAVPEAQTNSSRLSDIIEEGENHNSTSTPAQNQVPDTNQPSTTSRADAGSQGASSAKEKDESTTTSITQDKGKGKVDLTQDEESEDENPNTTNQSSDDESDDNEEPDETQELDIEAQFNNLLLEIKECKRMELWTNCCRFFRVDENRTNKKERFAIHGLKYQLFPHQLLAVYAMLVQERSVCYGGFLADEQGLGKTLECIALILVNRLLQLAHRRVRRSREAQDGKHLPAGPQERNAVCPTQDLYSIQCPCVNSSISSSLNPVFGPNLIFAPPALVGNWINEFNQYMVKDNGLVLVSAHKQNPTEKIVFDMKKYLTIDNSGNHVTGAENIIFITTFQSFESQLFRYSSTEVRYSYNVPKARGRGTKKQFATKLANTANYARIFVDEFHKDKGNTTIGMTLLRDKIETGILWFASGTPFEVGPKDILGCINALYKRWPHDNQELQRFHPDFLERGQKRIDTLRRKQSGATITDFHNECSTFMVKFSAMLQKLMIRRTADSTWFGQSILDLPEQTIEDVEIDMSQSDIHMLDEVFNKANTNVRADFERRLSIWRQDGGIGSEPKPNSRMWLMLARQARIIVTFPYLKRLCDNHSVDLTVNQILSNHWHTNNTSPYHTNLDDIVASSARLSTITNILTSMGIVPGQWNEPIQRKVVIFSNFPVICFILFLHFQRVFGDAEVCLYWAGQSQKDRPALIRQFADDESRLRIFISSIGIGGTGLTLTKADTTILVEPQWLSRDEEQARARVRRIGQLAERCFSYRMRCKKVLVEEMICSRQKFRKIFQNMSAGHAAVVEIESDDD